MADSNNADGNVHDDNVDDAREPQVEGDATNATDRKSVV